MSDGARQLVLTMLVALAAAPEAVAAEPERVLDFGATSPGGIPATTRATPRAPRLTWARQLPQEEFQIAIQRELASPIKVGDRLFVGSTRMAGVQVFEASTGRLIEVWPTRGPIEAAPLYDAESGDLFVADLQGQLYRFALTGERRWVYSGAEAVQTPLTLAGGALYYRSLSGQISVLDAATGAWRWSYTRELPPGPTILGASAVQVANGHAWAGFPDGSLVSLRSDDGVLEWEVPLAKPDDRWRDVDVVAYAGPDCLFASSYEGPAMCLDPESGAIKWTQDVAASTAPLFVEDLIVLTSMGGKVAGLDRVTGSVRWSRQAPRASTDKVGKLSLTTPRSWNELVLLGTSRGHLVALTPATGEIAWSYKPWVEVFGFYAAPEADGLSLFAMSGGGWLYHLALDGWTAELPPSGRASWAGELGLGDDADVAPTSGIDRDGQDWSTTGW